MRTLFSALRGIFARPEAGRPKHEVEEISEALEVRDRELDRDLRRLHSVVKARYELQRRMGHAAER